MAVFDSYSLYYDLLYRDKDYAAEADFVLSRLCAAGSLPKSLLDLGCGTGRHLLETARRGIETTGVDMSRTMLEMGNKHLAALGGSPRFPLPLLLHGDARSVRLQRRFAAVCSLFHVMSYQTTEDDFLSVLATAKEHLEPGGLFFFDFWHGPGVLNMRPEYREKTLGDEFARVHRTARPTLYLDRNTVDVQYTIRLQNAQGQESAITEKHSMRYWFMPELRHLARSAGFTVEAEGKWMDVSPATDADWAAWMMVRA